MARPFKILLIVVAVLLLLPVAAIVLFALLFDANKLKPQVIAAVDEQTGRELQVGGMSLSLFPVLGVELHGLQLANAPGFGESAFAELDRISVGLALLPALTEHRIEINRIVVDGLRLSLIRNADGSNNWSDLQQALQAQPNDPPAGDAPGGDEGSVQISGIDIAGIALSNARLHFADARDGRDWTLDPINLHTGPIRQGQAFALTVDARLLETAQALNARLTLTTDVALSQAPRQLNLHQLDAQLDTTLAQLGLKAQLKGDAQLALENQQLQAPALQLSAELSAPTLPGQALQLQAQTAVRYDGIAGTAQLAPLTLQLAGVHASAELGLSGLGSDAPNVAGVLDIPSFDARQLLQRLGSTALNTADPHALEQVALHARLSADRNTLALNELKLALDSHSIHGQLSRQHGAGGSWRFALDTAQLDLDRYLPPRADNKGGGANKPQDRSAFDAIEIPAETLRPLDVVGNLNADRLILRGASIGNARIRVDAPAGTSKRLQLSGQMFDGSGALKLALDTVSPPQLHLDGDFRNVQLEPLLIAASGSSKLKGKGKLTLQLAGAGVTLGALRKDIDGSLALAVSDGAIKGIDLGAMLRRAEATLKGSSYSDSGPLETDFASLSVSAQITDGVLASDDLDARSPLFRMAGAGKVDLGNETLDYVARPTIVGSTEGQGGKALTQLQGLTIPLRIKGAWSKPSIKLELDQAVKDKAAERLRNQLRNVDEDQLRNALGTLLGGRRKPSAPAEPTSPPTDTAPTGPDDGS